MSPVMVKCAGWPEMTEAAKTERDWRLAFGWLAVSLVIVLLDLWTKHLASMNLALYRPEELTSWLNLTLAHNYGAAFSFLSDAGGWQRWLFTVLASVVTVVLIVWLFRLKANEKLTAASLGMIIGGAVGNLIDRIVNGYVVDFIDVYYGEWHWPAFNLADSAITGGVILMLLDAFLQTLKERKGRSA
jgi:signal peptidase II